MNTDRSKIRLGALFVFICVYLWLPMSYARAGETPAKKILLIYTQPDHPHGSHMYEHECRLLAKCLEQTDGIEAAVSSGWPADPKMLEGVGCIAFYSRPAGEIVLSDANRERFLELMRRGVGYVAIHWATADS